MGKVDEWLACLVPRRCVLCHQPSGPTHTCDGCRDDLPWWPVPATSPPGPARSRTWAAFSYEYPVDRLVTGAKFHRQLHFALALGELMAGELERQRRACPGAPAGPDVLVPVPLHRRRLLSRGYNQAQEIARPLADNLGLPLNTHQCLRVRHTEEQTGLSARERRRNLRGAFAVRGRLDGARVAVVDDVVTTGATVAALVLALRQAGAAEIHVWAAARVVRDGPAARPAETVAAVGDGAATVRRLRPG